MEDALKIDDAFGEENPNIQQHDELAATEQVFSSSQQQQQQQQTTSKRKHRRGKPKSKNVNKLYKNTNWKFQMPRFNYQKNFGNGGGSNRRNNRSRAKLERSQSLVPYNTNKFLMEEHLAEVPSALLTPSGRTRDSSFSVDSEDNYFFSLPEDEEEFLTKEFANVYEEARVERLENLTKEELIEECLQIEDRYSTDQGAQQQQELTVQRISAEFMSKIRFLEEKIKELTRENYNLRCQLMRSAALAAAAAASPPSATAPIGAACQPTPMDSSTEDSESDSSSSSSSSTSRSGPNANDDDDMARRRARSGSNPRSLSRSSLSEYNDFDDYNDNGANNELDENIGGEQRSLLEVPPSHMDDDSNSVVNEEASATNRHDISIGDVQVSTNNLSLSNSQVVLSPSSAVAVSPQSPRSEDDRSSNAALESMCD